MAQIAVKWRMEWTTQFNYRPRQMMRYYHPSGISQTVYLGNQAFGTTVSEVSPGGTKYRVGAPEDNQLFGFVDPSDVGQTSTTVTSFSTSPAPGGFPALIDETYSTNVQARLRMEELSGTSVDGWVEVPDEWLFHDRLYISTGDPGAILRGSTVDYYMDWICRSSVEVDSPLGTRTGNTYKLLSTPYVEQQRDEFNVYTYPGTVTSRVEFEWDGYSAHNLPTPAGERIVLGGEEYTIWHERTVSARANSAGQLRLRLSNGIYGSWTRFVIQPSTLLSLTPIGHHALLADASETSVPSGSFSKFRWTGPVVRAVDEEGNTLAEPTVIQQDPVTLYGIYETESARVVMDFSSLAQTVPPANRHAADSIFQSAEGRVNAFIKAAFADIAIPDYSPNMPNEPVRNALVPAESYADIAFDWTGSPSAAWMPWGEGVGAHSGPVAFNWDACRHPDWLPNAVQFVEPHRKSDTTLIALARREDHVWHLYRRNNFARKDSSEAETDWEEGEEVWDKRFYGASLEILGGAMVTVAYKRETSEIHCKRSFDKGVTWEDLEDVSNVAYPLPLTLTSDKAQGGSTLYLTVTLDNANKDGRLYQSNDFGETWGFYP